MMALNFDKYAAEGNRFLKEYAQEMDLAKEQMKSGRILVSTLHALREIIAVDSSNAHVFKSYLCESLERKKESISS